MSLEENKTLVRRLIDAFNKRDLATLDAIATPDLAQQLKEHTIPFVFGTFGYHHMEIVDTIAEGDQVWVRLATRGGHTGEWMGIAPTGKTWTNSGVYFLRITNGKIVELFGLFDDLNLLEQLGATIVPPAS